MEMIDNAKAVATKAWSVRLAALATAFAALDALQPLLQLVVPSGTFAIISAVFGLMTIGARFIKQENLAAALADVEVAVDGSK
jgi:hypothetical protein